MYETLDQTGFLLEQTTIRVDLLHADFGDGYRAAARIGSSEGLRTWKIKIDLLPDMDDAELLIDAGEHGPQSRATYLWEFFLRSKVSSNLPFWIHDLKTGRNFLAEFVDDELSYDVVCGSLYATGLNLRQRRAFDQESPGAVVEVENPDQI